MGESVKIVVPGVPVVKGRARFRCVDGVPMPYTPRETRQYEDRIKGRAALAMQGRAKLAGPVSIRVMVSVTPPASWSKKKRMLAVQGTVLPAVRPDLDNYLKAAMDACNKIVFADDGQITDMIVTKRYAADPSLVLTMAEIVLEKEAAA